MDSTLVDIRFILVRPRNSGNVGSAVRVLSNFGFAPPRIVDMFRFDPDEAKQLAAGCEDQVEQLEFYNTIEEAIADRRFIVGTTATKRRRWRLEPLRQAAQEFNASQIESMGVLFGNEKSGLSEDEMSRCERLITIPTEGYRSLNLAQAVGIVAWELGNTVHEQRYQPGPQLAPREEVEPMLEQMYDALEKISFLHPDQDERIRILLRQMFTRNGLTSKDVQVLRGIWRQILWLSGQVEK